MQVPLEISTRWIDLSPPLEAELRKRAGRLERHSDRITSCRIAVERPTGNHHQEGGPFRVRVDVTVPGYMAIAALASSPGPPLGCSFLARFSPTRIRSPPASR